MSRGIGPLGRLGRWAATHRRTVVLAWVGVAVCLGVLAPRAEHALSGGGWQADGSESVQARRVIDRHFDGLGSYALGGGRGRLEYLELRDGDTGERRTVAADGLFVLIGARPRTEWLPEEIARDQHGFLLTGADLRGDHRWPLERRPSLLETSMAGVFASGDVRHGSVKRVASAVGEGSIAIQLIHSLFAANAPKATHAAKEAA
jgi:hypothetical protein